MIASNLYPEVPYGPDGLRVEVLRDERIFSLAAAVIDLTRRAYTPQLERSGYFEAGYFNSVYTIENKLSNITRSMEATLDEGGTYFVVRSINDPERLAGYASTCPGPAKECSIADMLADPPGVGIGSAVLHTALRNWSSPDDPASLRALDGSSVNQWYRSLGFWTGGRKGLWSIGSRNLPITELTSSRSVDVIRKRLERKRPPLKHVIELSV
jgi:hypothetical protein